MLLDSNAIIYSIKPKFELRLLCLSRKYFNPAAAKLCAFRKNFVSHPTKLKFSNVAMKLSCVSIKPVLLKFLKF